ncbi:glycoside hydrolase family 18 protein [Amylocystis lapponica]|nr:glycoside hydrolase family 18 protein [Amylocystis lapponica]
MAISSASIVKHTTASSPRPHVLYVVEVASDGQKTEVGRRYSEFVDLHSALGDTAVLPPKRILVTSFLPSAWVDDQLIAERKAGLSAYLSTLLHSPHYSAHPALRAFLSPTTQTSAHFNLEDALPSTLSRKAAMQAQQIISAKATKPIAAAYYPDWASDSNPLRTSISPTFATPNSSNTISYDSGGTSTLKTLVSSAHSSGHGTKVVLSIGKRGWDGSKYFSQAMSPSNVSTFVNACVDAVNTYDLDGIDIDWEYPGEAGAGNPNSPQDSAHLLTFFTKLRSRIGSSKIISAAVTDLPWQGSDGNPLTDVSAYAKQMTYVNIMNYDIWGAGSTPGPNAPLSNACGNSQQSQYSADAAHSQWTAANFPASQLMLGLPLYGYVSQSTKTTLQDIARPPPGFAPAEHRQRVLGLPGTGAPLACALPDKTEASGGPRGTPTFLNNAHSRKQAKARTLARARAEQDAGVGEVLAKAAGDLSSYWGQQIPFNQIVALGALSGASGNTFVQANGYTEGWDNCSDTPFLYDTARTTVVTYDDTYSLADKAAYVKNNGMAGCFTWSLDQARDDGYVLQNVIRSSLGLS